MRKLVLILSVLSAAVPMHGMNHGTKLERKIFYLGGELREGFSLLRVSAMLGDVEGIRKALQTENIDDPDEENTPLRLAAQFGQDEAVLYLLSCGAQIDAQDGRFSQTALHVAYKRRNYATANLLIRQGASQTIADYRGRLPAECRPKY